MTESQIKEYQQRIVAWNNEVEFKPYSLLGSDEFNFWYETLGVNDFWNVYDYSEFTTRNIIRRLVSGR